MKSPEQFDRFYTTDLLPELKSMDEERKRIKLKYSFKTYGIHLLIMVGCIILTGLYLNGKKNAPAWTIGLMFFLTIVFAIGKPIYLFIKRNIVFDKVNLKYKDGIIRKFIRFIDSDLVFNPGKSLPADKFDIRTCFNRAAASASYTSLDLVSGKLDGANFLMADIKAYGMPIGVAGRDNRIAFFGTYAVIELKRSFTGVCHIGCRNKLIQPLQGLTESAEALNSKFHGLLGALTGKDPDSFNRRLPDNYSDFETENTAFNRVFDVLLTKENSVSILFTSQFLLDVLKIYNELNKSFSITIKQNELHVYFDGNDQFDSDVHTDALNPESQFSVKSNYNVFRIVSQLAQLIN